MAELPAVLDQLATLNRHGFAFLLAYGLTWLAAAAVWRRRGARAGAYAVLFQGLLALPIALGLTALTATGPRPDAPLLDQLSVVLAMSQVFALPLVGYLIMAERHRTAVLAVAVSLVVHLPPYSWLYRTPLYLGLAGVLAVALVVLTRDQDRRGGGDDQAWTTPVTIGAVLTAGAVAALVI